MKSKKLVATIMVVVMLCIALSGCMAQVASVKLNTDGSGTISASFGVTEEYKDMLGDYEDVFTYNGTTYYGIEESMEFSSVEELMQEAGSMSEQGGSFMFDIEQLGGGSFKLAFDVKAEDFESAVDSGIDMNLSEEELAAMLSESCFVYNFEFPTDVKQTAGTNEGITIDGGKLSMDLLEVSSSISGDTHFEFITEPATDAFVDVPEGAWYHDAVIAMKDGGLIAGVGNNKFMPDGVLTVSQFCQIMARATGLGTGSDDAGYWAAGAIKSCVEAGYVVANGDVVPANYDIPISREAAVAAMYWASGSSVEQGTIAPEDIPDYASISEEYKSAIVGAYNCGITSGVDSNKTFSPESSLTRGQVCQLFYNMEWTTPKA